MLLEIWTVIKRMSQDVEARPAYKRENQVNQLIWINNLRKAVETCLWEILPAILQKVPSSSLVNPFPLYFENKGEG